VVGFIILSIILPMFEMYNSVAMWYNIIW
jgi:type II secretory pathway component PulF